MSEEKTKLVPLGALWKNEKNGNSYLSGTFGSAVIFVFKNKWKKKDSDPDYKIMVGPRAKKEDRESGSDSSSSSDEESF